jgi:hypothetical protein
MRFVKRHRLAVCLIVAISALAIGAVAYATIPGTNGVISGCYDAKTGALRVFDASGGVIPGCSSKEASLNWNQTGPRGATGLQGATGAKGATGAQGQQGAAGSADAYVRVSGAGIVNPEFSKNVTQANVTHPQTGVYCLGGLTKDGQPWIPKIVVGSGVTGLTPDPNTPSGLAPSPTSDAVVSAAELPNVPGATLGMCSDTDTVRVATYSPISGSFQDRPFSLLLDD